MKKLMFTLIAMMIVMTSSFGTNVKFHNSSNIEVITVEKNDVLRPRLKCLYTGSRTLKQHKRQQKRKANRFQAKHSKLLTELPKRQYYKHR